MKILITGANGQVGHALQAAFASVAQRDGKRDGQRDGPLEVVAVNRQQMNLADIHQVRQVIRDVRPQLIINAAAYTAVDQAQQDREIAITINAHAPEVIAEEADRIGAALIHYSTDYVFDGAKPQPYDETDRTNPLNAYGLSKLMGEQAILSQETPALIFRTQWVYGAHGKNFLLTMLRLAAQRDELRVVDDQFGAPTWSHTIARATVAVALQSLGKDRDWWRQRAGIYHLVAQGSTSWCGFARRIVELAHLPKKPTVTGISTAEYPTPAARPANGRLSCAKFEQAFFALPQWDVALENCLDEAGL